MTTWIATIDKNHKINAPTDLTIGEKVMIVRLTIVSDLLADPERRARFAATRSALKSAVERYDTTKEPSNEDIVKLVKQARKAAKSG